MEKSFTFPVHGFDQVLELSVDRFSLNFHGRSYFTVFRVEFLVDNLEPADIFHARHLIVYLVDFFLNQRNDFRRPGHGGIRGELHFIVLGEFCDVFLVKDNERRQVFPAVADDNGVVDVG